MAQIANEKLDSITGEVKDLHPLLNAVLAKLPRVQDVEYHHGGDEMGADFVISRTNDTFGNIEYIGSMGGGSNAELLEENLITHLRVFQDLVPTDNFDVEVDIAHPLEPAKPVRHGFEILFTLKPSFNL